MFKTLLISILFALAAACRAAETPDPSAWYTPREYQIPERLAAFAEVRDQRGETQGVDFTLTVDPQTGEVTDSSLRSALADIKVSINTAVDLIDASMRMAATNTLDIDLLKEQFKTLGENLTKVFQVDGMSVTIGEKQYSLRMAAGALRQAVATGSTVEYIDEDGLFQTPDYVSLSQDNKNRLQIKGWDSASPGTRYSLGDVLAGVDADGSSMKAQQQDHLITRSPAGTLNYVTIGALKSGGSGAPVDGVSITTNVADGATADGVASLYGWKWTENADEKNIMIPVATGSELDWRFFEYLFSPSFFEFDDSGRITLSGIDADPDDPVRLMTVSANDTGAAVTTKSLRDLLGEPLVFDDDDGKIALSGWTDNAGGMDPPLGNLLGGGLEKDDYQILARSRESKMCYLTIGDLPGQPVDGESITTNVAAGATADGVASLSGWHTAASGAIPVRGAGALEWRTPDEMIDNSSLGLTEGLIPGVDFATFEVKGASLQTAHNRYFGTPAGGAVAIGWHDLPNVTTNYIEGDEKSLTTVYNEGGVKKLGWKTLPTSTPSLAALSGESVRWVPYDEVLTGAAIAVDGVSIASNTAGQVGLAGWDQMQNGFLGKSMDGDLKCREFIATNGLVHTESERNFFVGFSGFEKGGNCAHTLSALLSNEKLGQDRANHQVLTRFNGENGPILHYVPMGDVIQGGSGNPDNVSIVTNEPLGKLSIKGCAVAEVGSLPIKEESGIGWVTAPEYTTAVSFEITDSAINASFTVRNLATGEERQSDPVKVCDIQKMDVVTDITYEGGSLKKVKKSITVIGGETDETSDVVFETTPLSDELQ